VKAVPLREVVSIDRDQRQWAGRPYVGMEDIESGTGRLLGNEDTATVKSTTFGFTNRHVLYGRLRPYLNKVLLPDFSGHCSTEIMPLLPTSGIDRSYLWYWLASASTVAAIDATCTGARMPRANMDAVLELEIPLPPLEEQRRIVAVLDEAFAAIAGATANAEKNLANARELFEAAFRDRFDHVGNGWKSYRLPEIAENWDYKRKPVTKSDRIAGDVPYYGASGQVDSVRDHLFDDELLLISEDGANLLMRTYPIAFSISGKSWVNNHAHILKFEDMATQRLVEYFFNSISVEPWVSGMAQPKLNQKALNDIPVPLPAATEREKLVGELDELADYIGRMENAQEARLDALATLKQSLLHRAFTGELVTTPELALA